MKRNAYGTVQYKTKAQHSTHSAPTSMLGPEEIQVIRTTLRSLLKENAIVYRVTPFDHELYRVCIDEAVRRGYPVDGDLSLRVYLKDGTKYAATTMRHNGHRPTKVWIALYTAANYFVDDVPCRFPLEIPNVYMFNNRFIMMQRQGNAVLDALADIIRRAPDLFSPVLSNLVITSSLDFVTSTLLDRETASMRICSAAKRYPTYQRDLSGFAEPYAFAAILEVMQFIDELNDVLSFYEELASEENNQISITAARNNELKLDTLKRVAESITDLFMAIVKIFRCMLGLQAPFRRIF